MKLKIDRRYLALPVSAHAQVKKLLFYGESGRLVFDLDVKLDPVGAQFTYYADLRAFLGQTLTLACEPEAGYVPQLVDEKSEETETRFRPEVHFTPERGWINDPNGLVYCDGTYHLFYQHNPVGMNWGNMHWGHATSCNLTHWEEQEIALFPDEMGTMYSGCALVDEDNVSGLGDGTNAPLLLFYTAAGGESELSKQATYSQCLAYSLDGGRTFKKYSGNPVVPHIVGGNRDPKVVFCPELKGYVMALYLDGTTYGLLRSENLLDWTLIQCISIENEAECPDFFWLELDGEGYWVLIGASDYYLVGQIRNGRFEPVQEPGRLKAEGSHSYAAQSYSGRVNDRIIRVAWNRFELPGMPFNGSMTTPVELFLQRLDGRITLCCRPALEWSVLEGECVEGEGSVKLPGRANDMSLSIPAAGGEKTVELCGLKMQIDAEWETVRVNGCVMHANRTGDFVHLRVVQDVHAVEVFSQDGAGYMCVGHLADQSLRSVVAPEGTKILAIELKRTRSK